MIMVGIGDVPHVDALCGDSRRAGALAGGAVPLELPLEWSTAVGELEMCSWDLQDQQPRNIQWRDEERGRARLVLVG